MISHQLSSTKGSIFSKDKIFTDNFSDRDVVCIENFIKDLKTAGSNKRTGVFKGKNTVVAQEVKEVVIELQVSTLCQNLSKYLYYKILFFITYILDIFEKSISS